MGAPPAGAPADRSNDDPEEDELDSPSMAKAHKKQLQKLEEKDPEFYQFLKEHDKELLEFSDEEDTDEEAESDNDDVGPSEDEIDEGAESESDDAQPKVKHLKGKSEPRKIITSKMVDDWCTEIKKNKKIGAIRCLLRAFRTACHYGDDGENGAQADSIVSSNVFNKIMLFVLNEMDGVLRELLAFPKSGGNKEAVLEHSTTIAWKNYGNLVKLYLGNALHVLNQMTDEQMVSFTLKRIKASDVFLAAFPTLLRKYLKVALHFWGTGGGALQVVSFLFLRDLCVRLGSDCLETCLRGIYKAYVSICKIKGKYVSASKLQHLRFLENCVAELCGVDLSSAYQQAFICIRQLATILRSASDMPNRPKKEEGGRKGERGRKKNEETNAQKKESYLKVYDWQFLNCLELWTTVICTYSYDVDFQHLAYPLTQIIVGVSRLIPTARYLPIRLHCVRMLNRIAASTGTFVPVSLLLLDVLEMKELANHPIGGVGKAVDFRTRKLLGKPTLRSRAFQEACIHAVVEQLAEHLAQWSYSIAFFELSFIPLVRLRNFCKTTKVDVFRKEIKELIRQVEANSEFTNERRRCSEFCPGDPCAASFLKAEKESRNSPLSQFAGSLKLKAQQRSESIVASSVLVGGKSSKFGDRESDSSDNEDEDDDNLEEGAAVFSSDWMPDSKTVGLAKSKPSEKELREQKLAIDEDVVEDLVLSSDDDEPVPLRKLLKENVSETTNPSSEAESKKRKLPPAPKQQQWRPAKKFQKNKGGKV